jgi:xanthine dehydrogenase YagS FAD-binding subunit
MAILGHSPSCVATHPPDMAVALTALGARVQAAGQTAAGGRRCPGCCAPSNPVRA